MYAVCASVKYSYTDRNNGVICNVNLEASIGIAEIAMK